MNEAQVDNTCYTVSDKALIEFCREIQYGEFKVKVQDGQPIIIEEAIKKRKLK